MPQKLENGTRVPMTITPPPLQKDSERIKALRGSYPADTGRTVATLSRERGVDVFKPSGKYASPPRMMKGMTIRGNKGK